jgi:hypothetical protein
VTGLDEEPGKTAARWINRRRAFCVIWLARTWNVR